jgi:hypothetical protein
MSLAWITFGVSLLSLVVLSLVDSAGASEKASATDIPSLAERLRSQGLAGWDELRRLQSQSEFVVNERRTEKRPGKAVKITDRKYTLSYNSRSFVLSVGDKKVLGGNPRYFFELARRKTGGPWFAAEIRQRERDDALDNLVGRDDSAALRMPWSIYGEPLQSVVTDPTFSVIDYSESADGSITVHFAIKSEEKGFQISSLRGGRFTCDPNQSWAVQSSEIELRVPSVFESAAYGPASGDFLNLTSVTYRVSGKPENGGAEVTWESQISSKKCELPPEAFTLSAFGLPEPVSKAERIRFWIWINAIALALIVLAFWLRSRAANPKRQ